MPRKPGWHTNRFRGDDRKAFGCTMTFEAEGGERLTLHHSPGSRLEIVRAACDYVVTLDPTFRMISYSTPETILADLDGVRADVVRQGYTQRWARPEIQVLARVGRKDMLHPSLVV